MSIIVNKSIVFLDSLQFCKASLDSLVSNPNNDDFKYLMTEFPKDKLETLKRKDAYPYEWVDSYKKFLYPRLPPKENFYSSIDDEKRGKGDGHISNEQYSYLQNDCNTFNLKTFREFHNHYFKEDVLLLADVFENFISTILKYFHLDPCHYFSAPELSWDAMLKMTKVELEKVSDADMHLFVEKSMRVGINYINKRFSKANNKYCPDYDRSKPEKYIAYLDMNDLYRGAMSEYLPYGGFKWVKTTNEIINKILNKSDNSLHGYFLEVDLEYPETLHDFHKDYPKALGKVKIKEEMLSLCQLEIKNKHDIKSGNINRLIPNLLPKKNCVVHYRNLKYDLSQGLIFKKVHKILKFKQSACMKPYIDFNTQKRKEATNEADKNLFKLLNNAVYCKTMENMKTRIKIRITTNEKDFLKYASRATYIGHKKIGKNLVVIHEKKELLTLNKPVYVGCTLLKLSKLAMYKFYYDKVKKKCKCKNPVLLDTDTDSLCFETEENFYEIMY